MAIVFECPASGRKLRLPDKLAGLAFRCPLCGQAHQAPAAEAGADAGAPAAEVAGTAAATSEPATEAGGQEAAAAIEAAAAAEAPRRRLQRRAGETSRRSRRIWLLLAAAAVVLAALATLAGLYVRNEGRRDRVRRALATAEARCNDSDFEKALERAGAAAALLESQRGLFGAGEAGRIEHSIEALRTRHQQYQQANRLFAEHLHEPAALRTALEGLREAVRADGQYAEAVAKHINTLLERAARQELESARARFAALMSEAGRRYTAGAIEAAADSARQAQAVLEGFPEAARGELSAGHEQELRRFLDAANVLAKAREIEQAASQQRGYATAIAGLRELAAANAGDAALKQKLDEIVQGLEFEADAFKAEQKAIEADAASIGQYAQAIANTSPRISFDPKSVNGKEHSFTLVVAGHGFEIRLVASGQTLLVRAGDYYFGLPAHVPMPEANLLHCGALAAAMAKAGVQKNAPDTPWLPLGGVPLPPAPAAVLNAPPAAAGYTLFVNDRVYRCQRTDPTLDARAASHQFIEAAGKLVQAILASEPVGGPRYDPQVRQAVAKVVLAAIGQSRPNDYLNGLFCRRVIEDGYIEQHLPGFSEQHRELMNGYAEAYKKVAEPIAVWQGEHMRGAFTLEGHSAWWLYDEAANLTTFAEQHPEHVGTGLFIHTVYQGMHRARPADSVPLRVAMVHRILGEVARYDPVEGTFQADAERWALGARIMEGREVPAYHGVPEWCFPPHVLVTDARGDAVTLVTPNGHIEVPDFAAIGEAAARRKKQDEFMDLCARTLLTPGELHLFFRYFAAYALDSPVEKQPALLGSSQHSGDVHQDYYQYLDRKVGGRYVGDCDDVAEFYNVITRRQGKLSYVLGVPQHATCGWLEPGDDGRYVMTFLDTMPPRRFEAASAAEAVEKGVRSYDAEGTMFFDPNSVEFLFRFAGEPTRTRYYLSPRIFEDAKYAETMIRVQGYWHFHTYLLAIRTMLKMLETDQDPANCFEVAALYGRVRDIEPALKWLKTGIERLPPSDSLSRINHHFRYVEFYRDKRDKVRARQALDELIGLLKQIPADEAERHMQQRFVAAATSARLEEPWKGWQVISDDVERMLTAGQLAESHGAALIGVYYWMKRLERQGRMLSDAEKAATTQAAQAAARYVESRLFANDDSFTTLLRKYGALSLYYAAELGDDRVRQELLKDGPYPGAPRRRTGGASPQDEDWQWIRLSPDAYARLVADDLNADKPAAEQKPREALALIDASLRAAAQARRFGSLAGYEYTLTAMAIRAAMLRKDWLTLDGTLGFVSQSGSARLHNAAAAAVGEAARFVEAREFRDPVMLLYARHIKPRPHYFGLAYAAYDARAYEAASIAAKAAAEAFPKFPEMVQEARYLESLIAARKKDGH